jgi:hypothetical protein
MARPVDPNTQYRVKSHVINGYTYASTQPCYSDPTTGKKKYHHVHWGTVDENLRFMPGMPFFLASPEERARLIFPEGWDSLGYGSQAGPNTAAATRTACTATSGCLSRSPRKPGSGRIWNPFSTGTVRSWTTF